MGFGDSIDEAKDNAIANLNASDFDDIQFEVVAMPKKKVLGMFGGTKAQVRAFVEVADKKSKKQNIKENSQENKSKKVANTKKAVVQEDVAQKSQSVKEENKNSDYGEVRNESDIVAESPTGKAIAYIRTILTAIGCEDITIKVFEKENASLIHIDGDELNILIGRRGETLDALQYLSSLVANNGGGHYRVSLNIGNYREKREQTLKNLADRVSAQVIKTGKNRILEPMNPYERRIIHTAVQDIEGVVSNSFGEGTGRRIVISLEGVEVRPPRMSDRRHNNRTRTVRPKNNVVNSEVNREPKRDSDMPLYGKIN